jgi:hypothetical protein
MSALEINISMSGLTVKTLLFQYMLPLAPVFAMFATLWLWFDSRYMHKEMSNARYIDSQIRVVQIELDVFHRVVDSGEVLTSKQQSRYEALHAELSNLQEERNRQLGIGDLPQ